MNHTVIISQAANAVFLSTILVGVSNLSVVANGNVAGSGATDMLIGVCISAAVAGVFLACTMMQEWRNANPAKRKQAKRAVRPSGTHWEIPSY
jgi:hypothetical protein